MITYISVILSHGTGTGLLDIRNEVQLAAEVWLITWIKQRISIWIQVYLFWFSLATGGDRYEVTNRLGDIQI